VKKILCIHGLANKPAGDILLERWRLALLEGLQKSCHLNDPAITLNLVYWADINYPEPLNEHNDEGYRYAPYQDDVIPEYKDGFNDQLTRFARHLGGSTLDLIGEVFDRNMISPKLLENLYQDLARYYSDDDNQTEVRNRLLEALNADQPDILIAHSMGTIVAVDVLRSMETSSSAFHLPHLLTIGSPLGLPYVVFQQKQEFGDTRTPENIDSWHNFADKRDKVCFDCHLKDDYGPNSRGVSVIDDLIHNTFEDDPHRSFGYLRCPELSRTLSGFL